MADDVRIVFDEAGLDELFDSPLGPSGKFLKRALRDSLKVDDAH